ncbi:PstS family phosphate ABC transporter substrate-binding protein [Chroococcidiopsis sp. SAG 2025]|uniref:PstS family phosphate ABC transporter substrate-binding protein n=1 Tax=Chroococcidiopsis sp. SAG 2025 TaxID=171389 RepID=UPI002936FC7C|nr:substrate-binding domain-containing protein [Chroococcidiopsis sp. SAG 2025]
MKVHQTKIICRVCGYDDNPGNASHCQRCHSTLNRSFTESAKNSQTKNSSAFPWSVIPLIALLLGTGGMYWFYRSHTTATLKDKPSAVVTPTKQPLVKQPPATASNTADIQSYASMQDVPNVPTGVFNYGGAACFAAMTAHGMHSNIAKVHPNFRLRYTEPPLNVPPGCSTGIGMLLDGELSFAQNGRSVSDAEYRKAKERNFTLQQVPVAIDGIVFFTHRNVPLPGLSVKQLQDIFLGKVTNWKQVGGPNRAIAPISQDPKVHATLKLLLSDRINNLGRNVKIVRDYTTAMRRVAATPGAISYSSASIAAGQRSIHLLRIARGSSKNYVSPVVAGERVNVAALRDGSYPMTRRLFIVIRRDRTPDEQAGVAYTNLLLSQEGQQIVEKAGFAAIH